MLKKSLAALFLVTVIFAQTGHAQPEQPAAGNAVAEAFGFIDKEKAVWEGIRTKRIDKLKDLLAPDYTAMYPFGIRDLQMELDRSASGYLIKYSLEPLKLAHAGDNLVVLLYQATATIVENGREKQVSLRASSVWTKRDGAWKVAFHTAMPSSR